MSSLTRVNWVAQQRIDLHHLLAAESYTSFDFRSLVSAFVGSRAYVLRGFEVIGKTGLAITINLQDSITFNPLDGNGSFYRGLADDLNSIIELPASQDNLFIEAKFANTSENPVNTAYWDPLALTGEDIAGTEYSASANSQVLVYIIISVNTVGFTEDAIPILRASTDGSSVTKMTDCRPLFFRLGSGGVTPNAAYRYPWGTKRIEPVTSGSGVGDAANSPFMSADLTGALNDKGIGTFKEWADAVMTRIAEISGSPLWYVTDSVVNNPLYGYVTGLDTAKVFLDNESGHCILPSTNVSLKWTRQDPTLPIGPTNYMLLISHGQTGIDDISTVKWQANYGPVTWELGGTFVNNVFGGTREYLQCLFLSPQVVDGGSLYLLLERDIVPPSASGNAVKWASNTSYLGFDQTKAISGVAGDFTGIAVGDWVRKKSEGFSQYYKVMALSNGAIERTTAGDIADATTVAILLDKTISTSVSTEEMMYFRSRYSQSDLHADTSTDLAAGLYLYRDVNYYWLGRRVATSFMLRGYGNMQEGEETLVKDDAFMGGGQSGSSSAGDLIVKHAYGAVYSTTLGYSLRASILPLLTIKRRKRDNTIFFPNTTAGDNSGACLEYTIASPVGLMSDGDGLWVRLSDSISGPLTNGPVVISADDIANLDTTTNKWQVLSPFNTPLRNFDNKDVYLIARKITLANGDPALVFIDGSIVNQYGLVLDHFVDMTQDARLKYDLYLTEKTPKSVLFIDQVTDPFSGKGRVDEDNVSFNYNKSAQELKLFNNVFGVNYHNIVAATDQYWFNNLGPHSLYLGGATSDIVIPGNLTVLGTETIISTQNVAIAGKRIELGVGNLLYGGGGSGMTIADNTLDWQSAPNAVVQFQTYAGLAYVDVTFTSDPLYVLGQLVGVSSNFQLDQITESEASMVYTRVALAAVPGDVQRLSATIWRFWTNGIALAGVTQTAAALTNWQVFDLLSEIHLSKSDTDTSGMTSWSFGVKRNPNLVNPGNEGTIHAVVTPYESSASAQDFLTIPKGRQANFARTRIPYAWQDGVGPSGSDTTFDFTDRLTWNYSTNTFRVYGTFSLKGTFIPEDDNTYDLGSTAFRWKTLHVGPGSVVVHNDNTNTNYAALKFVSTEAALASDAATNFRWNVAGLNQFAVYTTGQGSFAVSAAMPSDTVLKIGDIANASLLAVATQYGTTISLPQTGTTLSVQLAVKPTIRAAVTDAVAVLAQAASVSGGSITSLYGFKIEDLASGVNNYGLFSAITSGANKWFVYGSGNANSYFSGTVGIGTNNQVDLATVRLAIGTTADTTAAGGILLGGDVNIWRVSAHLMKVDDKVWLDDLLAVGTSGPSADSVVTVAGTSSDLAGVDNYGVKVTFIPPASTTNKVVGYTTTVTTPSFGSSTTLSAMYAFECLGAVLGTNASVTTIAQFKASDITVGSNDIYGFYSLMASGSKKWGLYFSGSATNYLSGNTSIGNSTQASLTARLTLGTNSDTTPAGGMQFGTDINLYRIDVATLRTDHTFVAQTKLNLGATVGTDAALTIADPTFTQGSSAYGVKNILSATAATTTLFLAKATLSGGLTTLYGYKSEAQAANLVATMYHFHAGDSTTSLATTAYAFYSAMNVGDASHAHWGFYGAGTAPHYLGGLLSLGEPSYTTVIAATGKLYFATATTPAGGISFGGGLSNLYRSADDTLKTDGNFIVDQALTVNGAVTQNNTLVLNGALNLNYGSTKTATYTILAADCVIPFDTTVVVANININLPAVTVGQKGRILIVKDVGGHCSTLNKAAILVPNGANKIDGTNASVTLDNDFMSLTLICNGVDGWILC